jgi:hypothetical protein
MPTLILRPWLSPTRLSLVLKAAREGLAIRRLARPLLPKIIRVTENFRS